jgi:hypothetical protein
MDDASVFGLTGQTGTARIVERQFVPGSRFVPSRIGYSSYDYVVDVAPDDGSAHFRATLRASLKDVPGRRHPSQGDRVPVRFNAGRRKVEFDRRGLRRWLKGAQKDAQRSRQASFAKAASGPPGSVPAGAVELDAQLREAMAIAEREHPGGADVVARLTELADLHERGALSDAEFAAAKAKILGA